MADAWKKIMDGIKAKRTKIAVSKDAPRRPKVEELTVQRISSEVSGKAQKYIRIGPTVFVPFEHDLQYSIENIKRA